jgi:trk system potassium uptake protein
MRVIIVGCGRLGAGLVQALDQAGHSITVIDHNPSALGNLGPRFRGRTIVGCGFDREVLLEAGVERADSLAAVTASDETNVVIARLARRVFRVPKVAARVYDPRKAAIYQRLDIQTISTTSWGISRMAELLSYSELDAVLSLGNGTVDLVEVSIPAALVERTVNELTIPGEAHVVAISRDGGTFLPSRSVTFRAGDRAHLVVLAASLDRVKVLLNQGAL